MKVKAIIKNSEEEWKEEFDVDHIDTAEEEIKAVVDYYNRTLRGKELKREFVKICSQEK